MEMLWKLLAVGRQRPQAGPELDELLLALDDPANAGVGRVGLPLDALDVRRVRVQVFQGGVPAVVLHHRRDGLVLVHR